jgi:hypothetical protein
MDRAHDFNINSQITRESVSSELSSIIKIHEQLPLERLEDRLTIQISQAHLVAGLQQFHLNGDDWRNLQAGFNGLFKAIQDADIQNSVIVKTPKDQSEWSNLFARLKRLADFENQHDGSPVEIDRESLPEIERLKSLITRVCAQFMVESQIAMKDELNKYRSPQPAFQSFEVDELDQTILNRIFFLTTLELAYTGEEVRIGDESFLKTAAQRLDQLIFGASSVVDSKKIFRGLKGLLLESHSNDEVLLGLDWFRQKLLYNLANFNANTPDLYANVPIQGISESPISFASLDDVARNKPTDSKGLSALLLHNVTRSILNVSPKTQVAFSETLPNMAAHFHAADCFTNIETTRKSINILSAANLLLRWSSSSPKPINQFDIKTFVSLAELNRSPMVLDDIYNLSYLIAKGHNDLSAIDGLNILTGYIRRQSR